MNTIAATTRASALGYGIKPRGIPSVLKQHALRCKPVAFKDDDKLEQPIDEMRKEIPKLDGSGLNLLKEELKTTLAHPVMDESAVKVNRFVPAFTRRREAFVGRLGMVGLFAACLWEAYLPNHPGVVAFIADYFTIPPSTVALGFLGLVAYNTLGALVPWSPTFSSENLRDVQRRPAGPPNTWVSPVDFKKFLGIDAWGFTKKNEIFNGRLAMLGFAMAIVNEWRLGWGVGPLAQVGYFLGLTVDDNFFTLAAKGLWAFTFFALTLSLLDGNLGNVEGEEEMY